MKKILFAIVLVIALGVAALLFKPTRAMLVAYTLPDFPDWPAPQTTLAASDQGTIYFSTTSPYDLEVIFNDMDEARATTGVGYLNYPDDLDSGEKVAAMVILPGSGGIQAGREHEYAAWFNDNGIATFVIDYYLPRGFDPDSNYMVRTSAVTEFDLIADAYSALKLLGSSPQIDPERIGVIGFSYGGMAARLAMDARIHEALAPGAPPFALHIDVYGPCYQDLQSPATTGAPLLTLRGTEDASNDMPACARREDELRELGTPVVAQVYQGVGHAWEVEKPRALSEDSPYLSGCEVIYDERGRPFLDGELLNEYSAEASLATRVAARFSSSLKFRDCVGYGYIIGRDDAARSQGYADILEFLGSAWTERDDVGSAQ